jgi:hypothetical protein
MAVAAATQTAAAAAAAVAVFEVSGRSCAVQHFFAGRQREGHNAQTGRALRRQQRRRIRRTSRGALALKAVCGGVVWRSAQQQRRQQQRRRRGGVRVGVALAAARHGRHRAGGRHARDDFGEGRPVRRDARDLPRRERVAK